MLKSISFIGGGVMAEAMIQGLISRSIVSGKTVKVSEPNEGRRTLLKEKYGIGIASDNREAAEHGETVVFAVKPQVLPKVIAELDGKFAKEQLLISIIAGARIAALEEGLSHKAIVRAMPNTPAQIGEGMTVWTASAKVGASQRKTARDILGSLGREVYVEEEKYLDMATAVSGSGPAYTFLVIEALIDAAVHLGFSRELAQDLVLETMKGSVLYAQKTGKHPAELRNMVTSPGGTTAEAIYQMEKGSLRAVLSKAVWAAYQKSRLLGESSGRPGKKGA